MGRPKQILTEEEVLAKKEAKKLYNLNYLKYYRIVKTDEIKKQRHNYRNKNKTKIKEYISNYRENNTLKIKNKRDSYKKENKDKIKTYNKNYKNKNKDILNSKRNKYIKNKKNINPIFKLKDNIRISIIKSLNKKNYRKNSKTIEILGCSYEDFKSHLESNFESWMTWDNYGLYNGTEGYGWDIDHKTPISSALTEDDIIRLNHYTNLQPLCSKVNRDIKRNNII